MPSVNGGGGTPRPGARGYQRPALAPAGLAAPVPPPVRVQAVAIGPGGRTRQQAPLQPLQLLSSLGVWGPPGFLPVATLGSSLTTFAARHPALVAQVMLSRPVPTVRLARDPPERTSTPLATAAPPYLSDDPRDDH